MGNNGGGWLRDPVEARRFRRVGSNGAWTGVTYAPTIDRVELDSFELHRVATKLGIGAITNRSIVSPAVLEDYLARGVRATIKSTLQVHAAILETSRHDATVPQIDPVSQKPLSSDGSPLDKFTPLGAVASVTESAFLLDGTLKFPLGSVDFPHQSVGLAVSNGDIYVIGNLIRKKRPGRQLWKGAKKVGRGIDALGDVVAGQALWVVLDKIVDHASEAADRRNTSEQEQALEQARQLLAASDLEVRAKIPGKTISALTVRLLPNGLVIVALQHKHKHFDSGQVLTHNVVLTVQPQTTASEIVRPLWLTVGISKRRAALLDDAEVAALKDWRANPLPEATPNIDCSVPLPGSTFTYDGWDLPEL